jgi:hypothetical protein
MTSDISRIKHFDTRPKVVILGIVRNCESSVYSEYVKLKKACRSLNIVDTFFVESDSVDKTREKLDSLTQAFDNFHYESFGDLTPKIPHRIERIRFCRNKYVQYLRNNHNLSSFDYAIIADMDKINSSISRLAIDSCFTSTDWDAIFSNQLFGVSDILALRAEDWIDGDYLAELEESRKELRNADVKNNFIGKLRQYLKYDRTRKQVVYDRMRFIGIGRKKIKVQSAFGGIGIYKNWCFFQADYSEFNSPHECEHVSFNYALGRLGADLFINPRFVNSIFNTYNINKLFIIRNLRLWRWNRSGR